MRGCLRFVSVLCAVSLSVSTVVGAPAEAKKRGGAKAPAAETGPKAELADLAKDVGLDDAQVKKMAEALKAKSEATKAWKSDPAKGGKLAELSKQLRSPEVKGDREKTRELRSQMKPLEAEQRTIEAKHEAVIRGILTSEQKQKWDVAALSKQVTARLRRVELSEEQLAKVKALCAESQKKIAALGDKDSRGKASILRETREAVDALLTSEQKARLQASPEAKPAAKPEAKRESRPSRTEPKGKAKKKGEEGK